MTCQILRNASLQPSAFLRGCSILLDDSNFSRLIASSEAGLLRECFATDAKSANSVAPSCVHTTPPVDAEDVLGQPTGHSGADA